MSRHRDYGTKVLSFQREPSDRASGKWSMEDPWMTALQQKKLAGKVTLKTIAERLSLTAGTVSAAAWFAVPTIILSNLLLPKN